MDRKNTFLAKEKQAESKKQYLNFQLTFRKERNKKKRGFLKRNLAKSMDSGKLYRLAPESRISDK